VTDAEREVAEERAQQGLPPRVTDPLILRRVASLVTAPTPTSTTAREAAPGLVAESIEPPGTREARSCGVEPPPGASNEQYLTPHPQSA
jgi:hypothetical protein